MNKSAIEFTAAHHATLFAVTSEAVLLISGPKQGEPVIRQAVKTYGRQRGKRMALRARENGHSLTVENYFAYGEWTVPKAEMDFKLVERSPHARLQVFKCPWYDVWSRKNVLDYGRYFCMEIDAALVQGFNPDLEFEVGQTRSNGGAYCDFVFRNADLSVLDVLGIFYKKKVVPGKKAIMPWDYHTGHLLNVLAGTVTKMLPDKSDRIMQTAYKKFSAEFSEAHLTALKKYRNVDFKILPY